MLRPIIRLSLAIVCLFLFASSAGAIERGPLPSFTIRTPDGGVIGSDRLIRTGQWLLVIVRPECPPCEAVLRAIGAASTSSEGPIVEKVVIVVGGDPVAALARWGERFGALAGASWLADPDGAAVASIRALDAPTIVGIRGGMIEWTVGGVLSDSADVRSIVSSWVGGSSHVAGVGLR